MPLLARPHVRWWAAALAMLLAAPSLGNGLVVDDHVLRLALRGERPFPGIPDAPFDLFALLPADSELLDAMLEEGTLPWWTDRGIRLSFWRPLSSLTHALDYALFPESVALMHLHSLLWLGALVLAASLAYRRLVPDAWTAGLATLLFALEDAHALPASWLANRNALIAGTFAILALVAHDRCRRAGWRPGALLGPLALAAGLLAGEMATCALAFLVAHALFLEEGPRARRFRSLLPYLALVAVWRVVYNALGHGASGSGLYVDPVREPLAFAGVLATRGPLLVFAQLANVPSDFESFVDRPVAVAMGAAALLGSALLAWGLWPVLRSNRVARFWAAGTLLSVVPLTATFANDRLLVVTSLGAMGLVAAVLARLRTKPRPRGLAAVGVLFLLAHVVLAPIAKPVRATSARVIADATERAAASAAVDSPDEVVVIVNAPQTLLASYVEMIPASEGDVFPAALRILGTTTRRVSVTRTAPRTLELEVEEGYFEAPQSGLFHDPDRPWRTGPALRLSDLEVEVLELTPDRRPKRVAARFDRPLDDPELRWVAWRGDRFHPFEVPALGETAVLPAVDLMEVFRP